MEITGRKLIMGHRGSSAYSPENTLPAFAMAADMGAFGVELDVMHTKDGELVVCHDMDLARVCGAEGFVHDLTLEELRSHNYAGKYAEKYGKVDIPTLEEVYNLLKPRGLYINVELKHSGTEFVRKVHDLTIKCGMQDKIIYSAFNHFNLTDLLEYDPTVFVAPLYGAELVKPADYAKLFGAKAIHPHFSQLLTHPDIVERAHELGIRVHTWTVDEPEHIRLLCEMDVDAIITNKPDIALEIANSFK